MRYLLVLLFLAAGTAWAGEYAVLASGSRLHVDRHETEGARIRLYVGQGYTEMDGSLVRTFEADEPAQQPGGTLSTAPAANGKSPSPAQMADAAADRYGLPRWLVRNVISAESGFQPQAVSSKGAIGLMQLMPSTAQALGADPRDAAQNVDAGTRYLRDLLVRYHYQLWHALAAYNAGPGAVDKYNAIPPYPETLDYIKKVDQRPTP